MLHEGPDGGGARILPRMPRFPSLKLRPVGDNDPVRMQLLVPVAALIGLVGVVAAVVLFLLISFFGNLFYEHRLSLQYVEPHAAHMASSPLTIVIVVFGALCSGLAIKYGDISLRGHGIPEVMEAVLQKQSRIRPRVALLKPLLAALSIGTGSPFGAEGPIIQTSGALGSLLGQAIPTSSLERKILLGCGAAAGMTCIFATPLAGVLLALELIVFEFSARAIIPIGLAAGVAAALRPHILPDSPLFPSTAIMPGGAPALAWIALFGVLAGLEGVGITAALYWVEDLFERIPRSGLVTRPMIGALCVGIIALFAPDVLGMGYDLIRSVLAGGMPSGELGGLILAKGVGWTVALASGTVGGVLAPLFLIAGSTGELLGRLLQSVSGLSPELVALVFMAAVFGAGSRAMLTATLFAVEVTGNYAALVPVLMAVVVATVVAERMLPYNIMTGKLVRRGLMPPLDYHARHPASGPGVLVEAGGVLESQTPRELQGVGLLTVVAAAVEAEAADAEVAG